MQVEELLENNELLEVGRKAVEDVLIDMRDSRIAILGRGNGLVCREKDGTPSSLIRLGTEQALTIALEAIIRRIQCQESTQVTTTP